MNLFSKIRNFLIISRANIQIGTPPNSLIGIFLAAEKLSEILKTAIALYFILCVLLVTFASNINCFYDISVDRRHKKYLSEAIHHLGKSTIKFILLIEGVAIFFLIYFLFSKGYFITSILAIIGLFLAIVYSMPPIRIKKRGYLSPLPAFFGLYLFIPLGGWYMVRNDFTLDAIIFFFSYFLMNSGFLLVNVTEDYQEDKEENIMTWAHIIGINNTMKIAFIFTLLGYTSISIILKHILMPHYSLIPTISSIFFLFLSFFGLLIASTDVYGATKSHSIYEIKNYAKKMPFWFMVTRYPMVIALFILLLF